MKTPPQIALPEKDEYEKRKKKRKKDDRMKFCEDCKCGWEIVNKSHPAYKGQGKLEKYEKFPPLGHEKEICPRCKVKRNKSLNTIKKK